MYANVDKGCHSRIQIILKLSITNSLIRVRKFC
nr:MAG TPA: hypothetical protein [Caudoviricetes sp.]